MEDCTVEGLLFLLIPPSWPPFPPPRLFLPPLLMPRSYSSRSFPLPLFLFPASLHSIFFHLRLRFLFFLSIPIFLFISRSLIFLLSYFSACVLFLPFLSLFFLIFYYNCHTLLSVAFSLMCWYFFCLLYYPLLTHVIFATLLSVASYCFRASPSFCCLLCCASMFYLLPS